MAKTDSIEPATRISSGKSLNNAAGLTFTDNDETVSGTVSAPSDVFGPAIERAMASLKIPIKDKPHSTQLDGIAVVNPAIGPEVYIEYSTSSDQRTQLKVYRNPRTTGQAADDVIKQIYMEIARQATAK